MKAYILMICAALLLLGAGCTQPQTGGNTPVPTGPTPLSLSDAQAIAQASGECMGIGNLTGNSVRNDMTKTWWFDLDTVKAGCSPACVVFDNQSAEVNWRCTGLIPPGNSNGSVMPGSDRDAHGCIPSAGYSWCEASQKCYRPWEENCTSAQ
jgi:hypothetical protein